MSIMPRDPLPGERTVFMQAIQARNEGELAMVLQLYPNVLWGEMTQSLSAEDRAWLSQATQNVKRNFSDDDDEF